MNVIPPLGRSPQTCRASSLGCRPVTGHDHKDVLSRQATQAAVSQTYWSNARHPPCRNRVLHAQIEREDAVQFSASGHSCPKLASLMPLCYTANIELRNQGLLSCSTQGRRSCAPTIYRQTTYIYIYVQMRCMLKSVYVYVHIHVSVYIYIYMHMATHV